MLFYLAEDITKHRIFWEEPKGTTAGPILLFDGVPFVINSTTVLDCQHGKIRGRRQSSINPDKVSECICVLDIVYTALPAYRPMTVNLYCNQYIFSYHI